MKALVGILLYLSALPGECSQQSDGQDDSNIVKLISELASDSIETRSRAGDALERFGVKAVDQLLGELPKCTPHVRREINSVIGRIRKTGGESALDQLRARIAAPGSLQAKFDHKETYADKSDNVKFTGRLVLDGKGCILVEASGVEEEKATSYVLAFDGRELHGRYGDSPAIDRAEDAALVRGGFAKALLELGPQGSATWLWALTSKGSKVTKADIAMKPYILQNVSLDVLDRNRNAFSYVLAFDGSDSKVDVKVWFDAKTHLISKRIEKVVRGNTEIASILDTFEGWDVGADLPHNTFNVRGAGK